MIAEPLVQGSKTPCCRLCTYLRRQEVNAMVLDGNRPRASYWRLEQRRHISAAHSQITPA